MAVNPFCPSRTFTYPAFSRAYTAAWLAMEGGQELKARAISFSLSMSGGCGAPPAWITCASADAPRTVRGARPNRYIFAWGIGKVRSLIDIKSRSEKRRVGERVKSMGWDGRG